MIGTNQVGGDITHKFYGLPVAIITGRHSLISDGGGVKWPKHQADK
jgi:hypothetical protein